MFRDSLRGTQTRASWGEEDEVKEEEDDDSISGSVLSNKHHWKACYNTNCWPHPQSFRFWAAGRSWVICMSDKFPAAAAWNHFENL